MYHSAINNAKVMHTLAKDLEMRILGVGQFLGIEDSLINDKTSKTQVYSNTAVCRSASVFVFYFDKEKCWEKLSFLGIMDKLILLAKNNFDGLNKFNKSTIKSQANQIL